MAAPAAGRRSRAAGALGSAPYADRHPGTLDLDIDRLRPLLGGWWSSTPEAVEDTYALLAQALAAMAGVRPRS
ncbi:hypothetical protein KRR39_00215 [Nocardioides panacis]|uniref:Uncharacterized protein n=1 Tax=Nocardioides panacis TaxID=2849501 RepID=A0A975T002_9ACTN|nr:hypothetical protein [Nocardioides panacis]QWZ08358.1 hypothetical protein KRR39_00215 [Nocardioides panacis]